MNNETLLQVIDQAVKNNAESLDLSNRNLTSIPPIIENLTNLTEMSLENNQLSELPVELGKLSNLTSLNLSYNKFITLPSALWKLKSLKKLDLEGNPLITFPQEIHGLSNLEELDLKYTQLTQVLPEISKLENLQRIQINCNKLTTLPPEIGSLKALRDLNVAANRLTSLPPEIGDLINLEELNLTYNQLTTLPPEIGNLKNLTGLFLTNNQLTTFPSEIGKLINLILLEVARNHLTTLPPEIGNLQNLEKLDLAMNQLIILPPEIGHLTNLARLVLHFNQLSELPVEIVQLKNLESLDITINQITNLPLEIKTMTKLEDLGVSDNPLPRSPRFFSSHYDPDKIINYYSQEQIESLKPNLYMVSIGISDYQDSRLKLRYADDDAKVMSQIFRNQQGKLYKNVVIQELYDQTATRMGILDALEWLDQTTTQKDVVVVFLAGHGFNEKRGKYYFLPADGDIEKLRHTAVDWGVFSDILGNLPSRVLLFLDTCHSGQLGQDLYRLRGQVDITEAILELASDESGVIVMAASTGKEYSLEHSDWEHGAFTKALIEGLQEGNADYSKSGIVYLTELDNYLAERVKELTKGKQHPTTAKPSTISRFPIVQL